MNIIKHLIWVFGTNWEHGGGSETQVISAPPAPSAGETAADISKARLQYDPAMAAQQMQLQQQYVPQQTALYNQMLQQFGPGAAQLQTDIQTQQMPQLQALQQQLFPQQTQVLEAAAGRALAGQQDPQLAQLQQLGLGQTVSQLQQPQSQLLQALTQQAQAGLTDTGLSPEQQAAIDAIRGKQITQVERQARGRAQLGGQLFGGRAEQLEQRAVGELGQAFAAEDVNRLLQQRQQAQQFGLQAAGQGAQAQQQALQNAFAAQQQMAQQAQPFLNILYPQAAAGQQAQPSPFGFQSAVPTPNAQLQAVSQLLGQQAIIPGQPSPLWGLAGALGGGYLAGR